MSDWWQTAVQQRAWRWANPMTDTSLGAEFRLGYGPPVIPAKLQALVGQKENASKTSQRLDANEKEFKPITPVEVPSSVEPIGQSKTAPIQIWEGEVLEVDHGAKTMKVLLRAKMGSVEDHTAEIDLQWVTQQDMDLVRSGAVFYWSLYKEVNRGSIKNSEELRFRRLPSWSRIQIERIRSEAKALLGHIKSKPQVSAE